MWWCFLAWKLITIFSFSKYKIHPSSTLVQVQSILLAVISRPWALSSTLLVRLDGNINKNRLARFRDSKQSSASLQLSFWFYVSNKLWHVCKYRQVLTHHLPADRKESRDVLSDWVLSYHMYRHRVMHFDTQTWNWQILWGIYFLWEQTAWHMMVVTLCRLLSWWT